MARNNDVFQVLVTKGNQEVLAPGDKVTALAPGQIGVFDANTNLSIDGSTNTKNFYLAVGLDLNGDGVTDEVAKSTGSHIQKKNIQFYSFRPHTASRPMKVVLKDFTADCETEYGIKLELRNQEIYRSQGYNQFTKTYSIVTGCCDGCEPTCPSGDANEITKLLKININNDPSGLIKATAIARQPLTVATHGVSVNIPLGGVVSDANLEAIMVFNAAQADPSTFVYTDLEIETITQAVNNFCSVNLKYFYPRETVVIATKIAGFKCNGTLEVTQEAAFEEGSGYDIKQLEYEAKGWKESPYRLSTLNGVADERVFNAVSTEKYDQIALTHDQFSQGAWLEYFTNQATLVAIPATNTVTRDSLVAILDNLITPLGFDSLSDDAANASTNPTVVENTSAIDDVTLDGIA